MILRYDDGGWQQEESGATANLFGVTLTQNGSVYAVGTNGAILRRLTPAPP